MEKSNPFLRATPDQIRSLLLLIVLLLCIVCWPAIQWGASAVVRRNPVHNGQVGAVIPRKWIGVADDSRVQAWLPCLTILCTSPRSSIEIQIEEEWKGKNDAWLKRAVLVMRERHFSSPSSRTLKSSAGSVQCLEFVSETRVGIVDSGCFASDSGLGASFEGVSSDLMDFYSIVASARVAAMETR
jgi:hypothetical protein